MAAQAQLIYTPLPLPPPPIALPIPPPPTTYPGPEERGAAGQLTLLIRKVGEETGGGGVTSQEEGRGGRGQHQSRGGVSSEKDLIGSRREHSC